MQELYRVISKLAPRRQPVLITGESGTGKELVARAIHECGPANQEAFVAFDCGALSSSLIESELFGHVQGAFTGASQRRLGLLASAGKGTLLLDEIAELPIGLQAKLLRFLEDGSFTRVGGTEELRVDVRLIAATNRDIVRAIAAGDFREDLFHRLNVVQFNLPPLRERGEDILLLAEHFLKQFRAVLGKNITGFSPAARQKFQTHRWPGNVRELRNVVERALILETSHEVQAASLPDFSVELRLQKGAPVAVAPDESLDLALERLERELIQTVLEQNNFSLTRAAERLRLSRHSLRYRMQRLNMKTSANDGEPTGVSD